MSTFHAAVWLDHDEAKVFHVDATHFEESKVERPGHHLHRPRRAGAGAEAERSEAESHRYFDEIVKAIAEAEEVLIVGPGQAKLELIKHVHKHHRELERKIIAVETVDHPTDGQLVAYIRKYFVAADKMHGS